MVVTIRISRLLALQLLPSKHLDLSCQPRSSTGNKQALLAQLYLGLSGPQWTWRLCAYEPKSAHCVKDRGV